MKSRSSALKGSFSAPGPISEKKIISAVKSAAEKEDKKVSVIIYGVDESGTEVLPKQVSDIF